MLSHSRTRSGPWQAAKAPAKLAIAQPADELRILHAGGEEVVAQQVGIAALGEERHVGPLDRLENLGTERVFGEHGILAGAVLGGQRGRLEVVEQLAKPIVALHG